MNLFKAPLSLLLMPPACESSGMAVVYLHTKYGLGFQIALLLARVPVRETRVHYLYRLYLLLAIFNY